MKINKITSLVTMIVLSASATGVTAAQDKISGGPSVNIPVTQLKYFDTGVGKNSGVGTLHAAAAYGDLQHSDMEHLSKCRLSLSVLSIVTLANTGEWLFQAWV